MSKLEKPRPIKPSYPPVSSRPESCCKSSDLEDPHDQTAKLSRPQEETDSYDFIIKEPDQDVIEDTMKFVNRFLRRSWHSRNQHNIQQPPLADSPLTYHHHQVHNNTDGSVHVAVAVRLRDPVHGDFQVEVDRLCDYLHSPEGRKTKVCGEISNWDIFGLEPVPRTTFLICWDSAFLRHMVVNTKSTVHSTLDGLRRLGEAAVRIEWVRVGCFLGAYYVTGEFRAGVAALLASETWSQDDLPRLIYSIVEMIGEILQFLATLCPRRITVTSIEWKHKVGIAKGKLDDVCKILEKATAAALPTAAQTVGMMLIKESYFSYRDALDSFSDLLTCNEEVWTQYSRWTAGWALASAGVPSASGLVLSTTSGVAALGAIPLYGQIAAGVAVCSATVFSAMKARHNREIADWCKQVDACLQVGGELVWDCERLTGYLYLFHNRGQENSVYHNAEQEGTVNTFLMQVQTVTSKDPRQPGFIESGGYRAFLQNRGEALQAAIAKHEDSFTQISRMSS